MKKSVAWIGILLLLSTGLFFVFKVVLEKKEPEVPPTVPPMEDPIIDIDIKSPEQQFSECMQGRKPVFEERFASQIEALQRDFSQYQVSVLYNNLLDDYQLAYNEKENYYSASSVKPSAALYYYTLAAKGQIDLEEQVLFSEKYWNETIRKRIPLNSMVSLRTLLHHSLVYSDNGAHLLLVERIGYSTLNAFVAETMKTENTFFPNSPYGRINAIDGTKEIKAVYEFIKENKELGQELKSYMVSSQMSTLKLDGIEIAQKYGWWKEVFHTVGIVYDKQPYTIVVLTKHGENKVYSGVIDHINKKIASFHTQYMEEKKSFCASNIQYQ